MSAPIPVSEALRLDAELVRLARGASATRLALGRALDTLTISGGHFELGFSSLEAYARERCERTGRWAADTRALARALEALPRTKAALVSGAIGWSTAELLARHVTTASEAAWLEKARNVTVRALRALLAHEAARDRTDEDDANNADAHAAQNSAAFDSDTDDGDDDEPTHTLALSTTREDAWAFECARKALVTVAGSLPTGGLLENLLAEGYSTLLELVPDCSALFELDALESRAAAESQSQAAWCTERARWRNQAEEICENSCIAPELTARAAGDALGPPSPTSSLATPESRATPESLDGEIRQLCVELSERPEPLRRRSAPSTSTSTRMSMSTSTTPVARCPETFRRAPVCSANATPFVRCRERDLACAAH